METVNFYRMSSGLDPVTANAAWSDGIRKHLEYLANTPPEYRTGLYANAHSENPDSPWYSKEGADAGGASNLGGGATERAAIESWMRAPFHAIGILRPGLRRSAFASRNGAAGLDVIRGLEYQEPEQVLFPGAGARVPLTTFGGESPDPRESCPELAAGGGEVGVPIIAMLAEPPPDDVAAELTMPDGAVRRGTSVCVITSHTYRTSDAVYGETGRSILQSENAVFVISSTPLKAGRNRVVLRAAGTTLADWAFSVVVPPAPPAALRSTYGDDGTAHVSWSPSDSGGAPLERYIVRVQEPGAAAPSRELEVDGDATTVAISNTTRGSIVTIVADNGPHQTAAATAVGVSGYWMLDAVGRVFTFGTLDDHGSASVYSQAVDIDPSPTGLGYVIVERNGGIHPFGNAYRDAPYVVLDPGESAAAISLTPSGRGLWVFTDRGRVLPKGDAPFLGDLNGVPLNGSIRDAVPTPSGNGYYLVGTDGGVFTFGDARFAGSTGNLRLNQPVRSLVPDGDGSGYWLVASDGGVFAFDAPFAGSMGGVPLNAPVTGMVRYGTSYLMVASDGGVFTFGGTFDGSLGGQPLAAPIVAIGAIGG